MPAPTGRFVRPATIADAGDLARLQRQVWLTRFPLVLPESALPPVDEARQAWADLAAASGQDDGGALVLVATEDGVVVGLLAAAAATDPDLLDHGWQEVLELAVDDDHVGRGHATRLLTAWADVNRAEGQTPGGVIWVPVDDDALRGVLTSSGFSADGAHRTLDLHGDGTITVRMVRLSCSL